MFTCLRCQLIPWSHITSVTVCLTCGGNLCQFQYKITDDIYKPSHDPLTNLYGRPSLLSRPSEPFSREYWFNIGIHLMKQFVNKWYSPCQCTETCFSCFVRTKSYLHASARCKQPNVAISIRLGIMSSVVCCWFFFRSGAFAGRDVGN